MGCSISQLLSYPPDKLVFIRIFWFLIQILAPQICWISILDWDIAASTFTVP